MTDNTPHLLRQTRRHFFRDCALGVGSMALASLLNEGKASAADPFANPLALTVIANNPVEPLAGGVIIDTAPASGASAVLSTSAVAIVNASASVTATSNSVFGVYTVTASAGAGAPCAAAEDCHKVQTVCAGLSYTG